MQYVIEKRRLSENTCRNLAEQRQCLCSNKKPAGGWATIRVTDPWELVSRRAQVTVSAEKTTVHKEGSNVWPSTGGVLKSQGQPRGSRKDGAASYRTPVPAATTYPTLRLGTQGCPRLQVDVGSGAKTHEPNIFHLLRKGNIKSFILRKSPQWYKRRKKKLNEK